MAIFYSALVADISAWVARSDVGGGVITSAIRMGEAELMRRVQVLEMETDAELVAETANGFAVDLPTGFIKFRRVQAPALDNPRCTYVSPDVFHTMNNVTQSQRAALLGEASLVWTVESNKIKVNQPAGAGDPITLSTAYFQRFSYAAVDPSAETNALLTDHYDAYLYASLMKIWEYFDEDSEIAKYERKLDRAVAQITEFEARRRIPASGPLIRTNPRQPLT